MATDCPDEYCNNTKTGVIYEEYPDNNDVNIDEYDEFDFYN